MPAERRAQFAIALADAGLRDIEAAAFVSERAVPSMAGGVDVWSSLPAGRATWWALIASPRHAVAAIEAGVRHLTVTVSASEAYSQKNTRRSIAESVDAAREIQAHSDEAGAFVDVVVSCSFGSPFDDVTGVGDVVPLIDAIRTACPGARLTLADTTGTATPRRIAAVLRALGTDDSLDDLGLHLHDTRGTALANAMWAFEHGVLRFDTATAGLGGSPFAPGAGGNLATEQLVMTLEDQGVSTGVDLDELLAIAARLGDLVGHELPSRVAAAGGLPSFDS